MQPTTLVSRRASLSFAAHAALLCTALMIAFGPLTPPGGAVTSTAKPLSEVEPRTAISLTNSPGDSDSLYRITQPGSYYLTGNITGVAAKHGIEIASHGVTVDLNGFDLLGVAGSLDGVNVGLGLFSNIAVVNGSVRSWGDEGVDLGTNGVIIGRVDGVLATGNGGNGISAGGHCVITRCGAYNNSSNGINTSAGCTIIGCTVGSNLAYGINAGTGCTIAHCTAQFNANIGIALLAGGTVTDCVSRGNDLDGILCTAQCTVRDNTCSSNGLAGDGAGIHATNGNNRIEGNNCSGADRGIDVDAARNLIIRNACVGNTTDWVIVANNVVGPIIDRRVPASAAINGFTTPDSTGSTHPNANFSY